MIQPTLCWAAIPISPSGHVPEQHAAIIFDFVAYTGVVVIAIWLACTGVSLLPTNSAIRNLANFDGWSKAEECSKDGSLKSGDFRSLGVMLLMMAAFLILCTLRGLWNRHI